MQIPRPVRRRLEPLPAPVRFSDGAVRLSTMRLALLTRMWWHIPGGMEESDRALAGYHGGDVIDIGAFHGWYSVLLAPHAQPGDHLVSAEPDTRALPTLRRNLDDLRRLFPALDLSILEQPVGDGRPVVADWPAGGAGHPAFRNGEGAAARTSITVDDLVRARQLRPRLIKVDVEGAEALVLGGMRTTLTAYRPLVILEIHPNWLPDGVESTDVEALLSQTGYQLVASDAAPAAYRQVWRARSATAEP